MPLMSPSDFLKQCEESSQAAYESLKGLLDTELMATNIAEVRRFLEALKLRCEEEDMLPDELVRKYHFSFASLTLDGHTLSNNQLTLIQLPSIFTPEEWSFTFYEGLARYPLSDFQNKTIAELGCGNGWISLALAKKNLPQKIIGLDINPRAIVCARLNLILNALDASGSPVIDADGKSLFDRVEFHVSDLLGYPMERGIQFDRILGCIPQVLSPEPLLAETFAPEEAADEYLYSLSNYCEKQGYIEDQFGLGLIARALEEAITVCRPTAKVILNLGGRPGAAVLERLFKRRGFSIRRIWSTKVWQANDTDIQPLVDIESTTPHRFEFFTSLNSDEPISAKTAQMYAMHGGRVAHSLSVYEAQIEHAAAIKTLFKLISREGFEESRSGLDLAFENSDVAEEKINFIGSIAEWMQQDPNLPYSDTEGDPVLRRQIAQFMRSYWRIPITAKSVFVAPNRRSIIRNLMQTLKPTLSLVEKDLIPLLAKKADSPSPSIQVLEAPKRADETCKIIEKVKPDFVFIGLQDFETKSSDAFVRLCDVCAKNSSRLVIDLSEQLELSSQPSPNGVLSYLSENRLPTHVSLLFGLVRNRVYNDLELCFLISESKDLLELLTNSAELTYSRAPLLTQKYYSRIFSDLLNFQLTEIRNGKKEEPRTPENDIFLNLNRLPENIQNAFSHPSILSHEKTITRETVRLDYGENCLTSPLYVNAAIMDSVLRQNISQSEMNVEKDVCEFISARFGYRQFNETDIVLGSGVAPLFAAILETLYSAQQKIVIPEGNYGFFTAASHYFNVHSHSVRTEQTNKFKVTPDSLDSTLQDTGAQWFYLNAPIVNPTGARYTRNEFAALMSVLKRRNCNLVLDTIFSGLDYATDDLSTLFDNANFDRADGQWKCIILGGFSKELAAGGLRFGWAACSDGTMLTHLRQRTTSAPHATLRHAAKKILQALNSKTHPIHQHLSSQRELLHKNSTMMSTVLSSLGWQVIPSDGGLFLCASPVKYLELMKQKNWKSGRFTETEAADAVAEQLFSETGLLLNNATWTGLPSHLRFVISVDSLKLSKAIDKLREFDTNWHLPPG